ncbi:MAG: LexA family transcriptional regulator [Caulobacter sp.]
MDQSERLRQARIKAGFATAADAARRFGWNPAAYRHHENGTAGWKPERAKEYAQAFGVSTAWLMYGAPGVAAETMVGSGLRPVPVVGEVAAGYWLEAAGEPQEVTEYLPLAVPGYERATLRALVVKGPSMNVYYPEGRYVVYVPPEEAGVRDGDHVIVRRSRSGLFETTIKELVQRDGQIQLWPRSTDTNHQAPIILDGGDELTQDGAEIIGVVVADYGKRTRPPAPIG